MKSTTVKARKDGKELSSTFYYSKQAPWKLKIEIPSVFYFSIEADDLFEALKLAREKASEINIEFLCNGARENVYPSPMARSMGGGIVAYELTMGQQALRKNLVKIFDGTEDQLSSPEVQEQFYQKWLTSL